MFRSANGQSGSRVAREGHLGSLSGLTSNCGFVQARPDFSKARGDEQASDLSIPANNDEPDSAGPHGRRKSSNSTRRTSTHLQAFRANLFEVRRCPCVRSSAFDMFCIILPSNIFPLALRYENQTSGFGAVQHIYFVAPKLRRI